MWVIVSETHVKEKLDNGEYRYTITRTYKRDKGEEVIVTGIGISKKLYEARRIATEDLKRNISEKRRTYPDLENQKKKKKK
jgi:hypothetical protein